MLFRERLVPYLLLAPQVVVTIVFFLWPAAQAIHQSVLREDPFGLSRRFVWFENFDRLFADPAFWHSLGISVLFSVAVAFSALSASLLLASAANHAIRGRSWYRILLIWPYAIAPAIAGVLWLFLFAPVVGVVPHLLLEHLGWEWNHRLDRTEAMVLVVAAAAWKLISYDFIFFLAGLQAIPKSLLEAADIDGASPTRRFWSIVLPLLSPTLFFLLVVNGIYAFFDTFGIIHAVTAGGPGSPGATSILVYKVYRDAFLALDLGASAAQSVVLMAIVVVLTIFQFRAVERRVHYA